MIVFFVVGSSFAQMLRFTVHGVNTFAIGGNRRAALDAGVNVTRHVLANFALSGAMAGLVGLIMVAQLGAASPVYRQGLRALGGHRRRAWRHGARRRTRRVLGTVVADLSLTVLRNGLNLMRIEVRYVLIILGAGADRRPDSRPPALGGAGDSRIDKFASIRSAGPRSG